MIITTEQRFGPLEVCYGPSVSSTTALYWVVPSYKRGSGRPRINWIGISKKGLLEMVSYSAGKKHDQQLSTDKTASECGPMHPLGCRTNQGEGHCICSSTDITVPVGRLSAHLRRKSPTKYCRPICLHLPNCRATDQNSSG